MNPRIRTSLGRGVVIPAMPLALNATRKLDERRQRALCRYYVASGAGGLAVGVHTTQFAIRDPKVGLYEPLLDLLRVELDRADAIRQEPIVRIAGVIGRTEQAVREATVVRDHGYHAGLLSLAALRGASDDELIDHCRAVADVIPIFGFYLQPAAGGRVLPYSFWRRFVDIQNVVAIKIAPFNRYQTIDVIRAVAEAGRNDVALYTGNDDNIVLDLITPFQFDSDGIQVESRIVGGLLGHWAVWTQRAVELLNRCHAVSKSVAVPDEILRLSVEVTDANAAFFDAANGYAGVIAGLHEVLRRQGLLEGVYLLDEKEALGPGQLEEIDRVYRTYPHLNDDTFVAEHIDEWMR